MTAQRLRTPRLDLILADAAMLRADASDRGLLSRLLNAVIPAEWPPELFRDHQAVFADRLDSGEWGAEMAPWYWVLDERRSPRTLIGSGGLMPVSGAAGDVLCGYAIIPSFHGRGLATEAMRSLVALGFTRPGVRRAIADTYPHLGPSIRVMEKLGMTPTDAGPEPGTIRHAVTKEAFAILVRGEG